MEANLKPRVLTASVGVPFLALLVGWGSPWVFSTAVLLVTVVALAEYFAMAFPKKKREQILGVFLGILTSLGVFLPELTTGWWFTAVLAGTVSVWLSLPGSLRERLVALRWTVLGAFYVGLLVPHFVELFSVPYGREWTFFVLLVVMTGDTVGYFIGTSFGRKKLAPTVSPGKTVEGALGFMAGSVFAGIAAAETFLPATGWVEVAVLSGILNVLGQVGDLFESKIKRIFSVKDSGALLPGHGGLLDRLDSLIFPVVFTTYYLRFFRP